MRIEWWPLIEKILFGLGGIVVGIWFCWRFPKWERDTEDYYRRKAIKRLLKRKDWTDGR